MLAWFVHQGRPVWAVLSTPRFSWLLRYLLAIDACLGVLHMANALTRHEFPGALIALPIFNLGTDRGLGELFGYGKLIACAWFSWRLFSVRRSAAYATAGVLYLVALMDDAVAVHEYIGHHVAFISTSHRIGELLALTLAATAAAGLFIWALYKTPKADAALGVAILALFGLLAGFAGLLDVFHVLVIVEEGAELATLSLHCAFLAALYSLAVRKTSPFSSPK